MPDQGKELGQRCRFRRCPISEFSIEHFHAADRPSVTVFHTAEERTGRVTIHEGWGADNGSETATFDTAAEAVSFCKRRYGVDVEVPHGA